MIMKANKQIGFIYKNNESIDKILKDGEVVFERGFLREKTSTTLPINFGGVGKDLKDYKIYGNTKQQLLPDGYTQVDYIESSGTQYIDTGVNADYKLSIKFEFSNLSQNSYQGAMHGGTATNRIRHHLQMAGNNNVVYWAGLYDSGCNTIIITGTNYDSSKKYNLFADIYNQKYYLDDVEISGNFNSNDFDTELNYYLFGRNTDNGVGSTLQMKMYSCQMYYSNVLVRDFIPCYRNSDNEVGLYDLVNDVFYTNQGIGVFTYGSVAPTPDAPIDMVSCGDRTKNLWGGFNYSRTHNGITHTYNIDGTITLNGTSSDIAYSLTTNLAKSNNIYIRLLAGTYTISGGTSDVQLQVISTNGITLCTTYSSGTFTINEETYAYLRTQVIQGKSFDNEVIYIQLEQGPFVTQYEPYYTGYKIPVNVNNVITNIYLDEPLRKIDEYSDYIDFKNGKVVRNIKEHTFTSDDAILGGTASQDGYARVGWGSILEIAASDFDKTLVICNKFLGVPQNDNTPSITGKKWQCSLINTDRYKIMFRSGDLSLNNQGLANLIKNNDTKVCYPLLTPTEETITLPNIPTIDGNNTLNIETEITPSQVYIKYKSNE